MDFTMGFITIFQKHLEERFWFTFSKQLNKQIQELEF